jgi:hypothetical protein
VRAGIARTETSERRASAAEPTAEEDERLAREVLAQLREGWGERRRTIRSRAQRRLLEACALEDTETLAWKAPEPSLTDLLLGPDPCDRDVAPGLASAALGPPGETRRALAVWARYRLACLELLGTTGRTGDA